jgi:UDP-3-O-[3-hydroxymyristoyl] glucosamine N-acyltransferase
MIGEHKMADLTLEDIARLTGGYLVGDGQRIIHGVCSPEDVHVDMLCVVWEKRALSSIPENIAVLSETGTVSNRDGIEMPIPRASLVKLLPLFDRRKSDPPGIHPMAFLHESSTMGGGCYIGPGCVISEGAKLGERVVLQANVFVGKNVSIGDGTIVEASVAIQDFVEVGAGVVIHSGAAIGCEGFGFVPLGGGWEKIPQIGTVVIEDEVEIGPNCTVDRATFGTTRIGRGTKMGACVHIAHNCDIGRDSMMVGFIALGGSVKTGKGLLAAGMSGIADHVTIGERVTVAGRAGVTKDVGDGEIVSGFPAQRHLDEKRFQASLRTVKEMRERIKKLEKMVSGD